MSVYIAILSSYAPGNQKHSVQDCINRRVLVVKDQTLDLQHNQFEVDSAGSEQTQCCCKIVQFFWKGRMKVASHKVTYVSPRSQVFDHQLAGVPIRKHSYDDYGEKKRPGQSERQQGKYHDRASKHRVKQRENCGRQIGWFGNRHLRLLQCCRDFYQKILMINSLLSTTKKQGRSYLCKKSMTYNDDDGTSTQFNKSNKTRQSVMMIVTEQLELFRVRTEESQEYSAFDFSTLRDSVDSIQIIDDCVALPPFSLNCIPETQILSARSTNYSSKDSQKHSKPNIQQITRSLTLLHIKPMMHQSRQLPLETVKKLMSYYKCPNLGKTGIQDRAFGAMFGTIIGDSIGAYSINKVPTINQIQSALMMQGGGVLNLLPGEGTDQWQLNMALAEGLIAGKGCYNRDLIAGKYLEWIESKPKDLPVLVGIALSNIRRKERERTGLSNETKGLGYELIKQSWRNIKQESALGLMRVVPLVIWGLSLQNDEFQYLIQEEMKMIAPNSFSVQITLLFSKMLRTLILTGSIATALSEASSIIDQSSSSELSDLWSQIVYQEEPLMSSANANNVRFPFYFAVAELMRVESNKKDLKKEYLEVLIRTLSRGFNSDMNSSVVLTLIGAAFGYNNTPAYFRNKIINAPQRKVSERKREYWSGAIVPIVDSLLKDGPLYLDDY